MATLFVSYASSDRAFVQALSRTLDALGHGVFFDRDLVAGTNWWQELLDRIEASDGFLPVLSPRYLASDACAREADWAIALGIPLLPIDAGVTDPRRCRREIAVTNWVRYDANDVDWVARLSLGLSRLGKPNLPAVRPQPPEIPMDTPPAVTIDLLGPLRLKVGGVDQTPTSDAARAVLAMLAISAGQPVPRATIDDGTAHAADVDGALTELSTTLPLSRLTIDSETVTLHVGRNNTDIGAFDASVNDARGAMRTGELARAAETLRAALRLWRGDALADLREQPFAPKEVVRFEQARMAAIEDRVETDLGLGNTAGLVDEISGYLAEYPLRERLWGQLMVALQRAGRRGDALTAYDKARLALIRGLGLSPGPALVQLYDAIRSDVGVERTAGLNVARPGRLPQPATPLVGREAEIATVLDIVGGDRLVTITGPGGSGKTRVALETARRAADRFPGQVHFFELAGLTRRDDVLGAIGQALHVDAGDSVLDSLADALEDRDALFVLDNFEHVLSAAADLSALLGAAPRLHVLATSRSALRIAGEIEIALAGLAVPGSDADLVTIAGTEAVRLFVARAHAIRDDFKLDAQHAQTAADICRRLDGLPLAIELAAARLRVLPLSAIAERLDHALDLLVVGQRDAPARHRTLRATIAWSVDLLEEADRSVLRALAQFVGGFFLDAVVALCGPPAEDGLDSLISSSLVQRVAGSAEPRFQLPEPVRQYVLEQLSDGNSSHIGFVEHYTGAAERACAAIDGPDGPSTLARVSADLANFAAACDRALEAGNVDSAARIAVSLVPFWLSIGWVPDGRSRLSAIIAANPTPQLLAAARVGAGRLAYHQGDADLSAQLLQTALQGEAVLDGDSAAVARCILAVLALGVGDTERAADLADQALAAAISGGHYVSRVLALSALAVVSAANGDFDAERQHYVDRLQLARAHGDAVRVADTLTTLGEIAFDDGDYARAAEMVREALSIADPISQPESRDALIMLGRIAIAEHDSDRADGFLDEALRRCVTLAQPLPLALCVRSHGAAAVVRGELPRAARLFGAGEALQPLAMPLHEGVERDLAAHREECRRRLGDAVFAQEHAAGAAMEQLSTIVEFALDRTAANAILAG
jgi:predicted ATPase/DNA-binding SARP family transcriptional activator